MSWESYLSFLLVSSIIIIVPGPNVTLILATSALQGVRQGFLALAGTTIAQTIQVTLVAIGLVWLVETYSAAFEIVQWLGAAYLIYLGVQTWISASDPLPEKPVKQANIRKGFLVGLANPKSLSFFAAFFPQFIDSTLPTQPQFAMLAASYVILALLLDSCYAVAGGFGGKLLATDKLRLILGRICGGILVGGGLLLAKTGRD